LQITCSTEGERERKNKQIIGKHKMYENILNFIRETERESKIERARDRDRERESKSERARERERVKDRERESNHR
jgi:hypothetical protein